MASSAAGPRVVRAPIGLVCIQCLLTPPRPSLPPTINAAHVVSLGDEVGSLEPGKQADLVILDAPSHLHLVYWFGRNLVRTVVKGGRVVYPES